MGIVADGREREHRAQAREKLDSELGPLPEHAGPLARLRRWFEVRRLATSRRLSDNAWDSELYATRKPR